MTIAAHAGSPVEAACVLRVGDRVALRASGPPEAEYALFDFEEIELRASEPRRVHEHGYRTTAALARDRLSGLGFSPALAREVAIAMQPVIADVYARGPTVRRIARYLGPAELLQPDLYDASDKAYRGFFLDLAALARDVALERASATLQALYLSTVLDAALDDDPVVLSTAGCREASRPGARTYKRAAFCALPELVRALGALAERGLTPTIDDARSREEVLAFLASRVEAASDDDARAFYRSLESAVGGRAMPERGPLAAPEIWALEARIDAGELEGALEALGELEGRSGRTPATTYLRARLSLALELEPPTALAERVSALALSMSSFQELALLAAECWLEAGEPRRSVPYARDLVGAPGIDAALRERAERVLTRATAPGSDGAPAEGIEPSAVEPPRSGQPPRRASGARAPSTPPAPIESPARAHEPRRGAAAFSTPPAPLESPAHARDPGASVRRATTPGLAAVRPPPELETPPAPPALAFDAPSSEVVPKAPRATLRMTAVTSDAEPRIPREPPPLELDVPRSVPPRLSERPRSPTLRPGAERGSLAPPSADPPLLGGANLPAYLEERGSRPVPADAVIPHFGGSDGELAEHLSLPPELEAARPPLGELPRSALDARVAFTLLARELGRDYRLERGALLQADLTGIEMMQAALLETFHASSGAQAGDEAYEIRRHGALLAEILARRLGAAWVDTSAAELGYWAMLIPPNTRVWPFGRIARLIAMGHRERDLVSYYLELQARSKRA